MNSRRAINRINERRKSKLQFLLQNSVPLNHTHPTQPRTDSIGHNHSSSIEMNES